MRKLPFHPGLAALPVQFLHRFEAVFYSWHFVFLQEKTQNIASPITHIFAPLNKSIHETRIPFRRPHGGHSPVSFL